MLLNDVKFFKSEGFVFAESFETHFWQIRKIYIFKSDFRFFTCSKLEKKSF